MKNLSLSNGDYKIEIGSGRKIDLLHILAIIHYIVKTATAGVAPCAGQYGPEWSQTLRVAQRFSGKRTLSPRTEQF